jgi:hypothetical protein
MEKRTAGLCHRNTLEQPISGQVSLTVEQYRAVIPVVSVFVGCKYRARNLRGLIATRNIFCRRKRHQLCGSLAAVPQQLGSRPISIPTCETEPRPRLSLQHAFMPAGDASLKTARVNQKAD